jgi:hypothetical protein
VFSPEVPSLRRQKNIRKEIFSFQISIAESEHELGKVNVKDIKTRARDVGNEEAFQW